MSEPDINDITAFLFRFFKTHKSKFTIFERLDAWPKNTLYKIDYTIRNFYCGKVSLKIKDILQEEYVLWNSYQIVQFYISTFCPISDQNSESGYVSLQNNMTEVGKIEFHSLMELEGILLKLFDIKNEDLFDSDELTDSSRTTNATPLPASDKKTEILNLLNRFVETICQDASKSDLLLNISRDLMTLITGTPLSKSSTAVSGEEGPLSKQIAELVAMKEKQLKLIESKIAEDKEKKVKIDNFERMSSQEKTEFVLTLELDEIKRSIPGCSALSHEIRKINKFVKMNDLVIPCSLESLNGDPFNATLRFCLNYSGSYIMFPVINISSGGSSSPWSANYHYFNDFYGNNKCVFDVTSFESKLTHLNVKVPGLILEFTVRDTKNHKFVELLKKCIVQDQLH
jgi:hypothetical protein